MKDAVWETRMDAARDDIKGLFNHAILGNRLKNVPKLYSTTYISDCTYSSYLYRSRMNGIHALETSLMNCIFGLPRTVPVLCT